MSPGMWIFMLLFWGLVVIGIVAIVRWYLAHDHRQKSPEQETPLEILKKRYARGEIAREEYEQMKKDLE